MQLFSLLFMFSIMFYVLYFVKYGMGLESKCRVDLMLM